MTSEKSADHRSIISLKSDFCIPLSSSICLFQKFEYRDYRVNQPKTVHLSSAEVFMWVLKHVHSNPTILVFPPLYTEGFSNWHFEDSPGEQNETKQLL